MIEKVLLVVSIVVILVGLSILFKPKKEKDEYLIFKKESCDGNSCGACWFGQNIRTGEKTECFREQEKLRRYINGN